MSKIVKRYIFPGFLKNLRVDLLLFDTMKENFWITETFSSGGTNLYRRIFFGTKVSKNVQMFQNKNKITYITDYNPIFAKKLNVMTLTSL